MSDLEGINAIPQLMEKGITSLKIEGRMRSAQYVGSVVSAYRLLIDYPDDPHAAMQALGLLEHAMGRKTSGGYFFASQPKDVLAPQHSGNIGLFLGKIQKTDKNVAFLTLNSQVKLGDRLRVHHERSGERTPFTLRKMWRGSKVISEAPARAAISMETNMEMTVGDSIYRVDIKETRFGIGREKLVPLPVGKLKKMVDPAQLVQRIMKKIRPLSSKNPQYKAKAGKGKDHMQKQGIESFRGRRGRPMKPVQLPLWVRIDNFKDVRFLKSSRMARLVIELTPATFPTFLKVQKHLRPHLRQLVWALPPVIEENNLEFYRQSISALLQKGFNTWQIGHVGQLGFFGDKKEVVLAGDYTLNVLNSMAVSFLAARGLRNIQFSIETDRKNLAAILKHKHSIDIGVMLYGRPPLFTARLAPAYFRYKQPFISPKGEKFILDKRWGQVVALSENFYSLFPWLQDLHEMGVGYGVVDCNNLTFRSGTFEALLGSAGHPLKKNQSSFNFNTALQ